MGRKVFRRSVTTTSTTRSDLGEVGDERFESGKRYRLCYTVATQPSKGFLQLATADASLASYQVVAAATNTPVFACNDTGASLAGSTYFWALVEGPLTLPKANMGENFPANTPLGLSTSVTQVETIAADGAVSYARIGHSIAAVTSSTSGNTVIWFQPPRAGNTTS